MIHYGNTEGCDYMKGEDIVVIGTPHYNEMVYKLFAAHLDIDVNSKRKLYFVKSFSSLYGGTAENDFAKSKQPQGLLDVFLAVISFI